MVPESKLRDVRQPRVVSTVYEIRQNVADLRRQGRRVGLVPTMGALHEGHLSLASASRRECDSTIVTIFVNPTQFGPQEDFTRYPRTLAADLELLAREQVDVVFVPAREEMYPPDATTGIDPPSVAAPLEGVCRPGHFRGVATIVLKLFHLIPADVAYFGQKDYQQCRVVERMVADLNVPIVIRRCPIVREPDGLAMSSRNRYLSLEERQQASAISACLRAGRRMIDEGQCDAPVIRQTMRQVLNDAGITRIDYVSIADPDTLTEMQPVERRAVLLVAAHVGSTRLIDNCAPEPGAD